MKSSALPIGQNDARAAPLRVGLIGAGGIGALRAEAVQAAPGLKLAAVADALADRAGAVAARFGAEASPDGLSLAQRPDVDLVIVSTPPDRHAEFAVAALAAGKAVLCEKPLAHTLAAAEEMCGAAEKHGGLLKTGFNHRYYPAMAFARKLIDNGQLGEIVGARAYAGHPGGVEFGHDWVHEGTVTGGGSLVDNGIHLLDLIRFLFGEVQTAMGCTANLIWPFADAEDNAVGYFRSAAGGIAQVHASWTEWRGYRFGVEVFGTRGYARAAYPPMMVEWGHTAGPGTRARRRYEMFPRFQVLERLRSWRWSVVNTFVAELGDFAAGIRAGRETPATGRDGLRAMQMAHAIYRSSRERREIEV